MRGGACPVCRVFAIQSMLVLVVLVLVQLMLVVLVLVVVVLLVPLLLVVLVLVLHGLSCHAFLCNESYQKTLPTRPHQVRIYDLGRYCPRAPFNRIYVPVPVPVTGRYCPRAPFLPEDSDAEGDVESEEDLDSDSNI